MIEWIRALKFSDLTHSATGAAPVTFLTEIKMLICKIFLRKFKHKVSGSLIAIITFQILSNIPRANLEMLKNEICSLKDYFCRNFYHTKHLLNVSLKWKTENISIFIWHVTTEKRAKGISMLQNGVVWLQENDFSQECLQIQDFCWQMSQFMTKQTSTVWPASSLITFTSVKLKMFSWSCQFMTDQADLCRKRQWWLSTCSGLLLTLPKSQICVSF